MTTRIRVVFALSCLLAFSWALPMLEAGPKPGDFKTFVGDWSVGRPGERDFTISLYSDFTAQYRLPESGKAGRGSWAYVNGEARITWPGGSRNVIRASRGKGFEKLWFKRGTSLNDPPTDVGRAKKIK
jgi:hypothetical protein